MTGIQLTDMDVAIEPVRDSQGLIAGGFAVGDILRQNQAIILQMHQGEQKEVPALGAGISDMLLDSDPLLWRSRIKEQLERDGQKVRKVTLTETSLSIDANY